MLYPRTALLLALLLAVSATPLSLTTARAQNPPPPPKPKQSPAVKAAPPKPEEKPDYSQEAVVIENLKLVWRFEPDGTGQRELSLRVKVQSDAGLAHFGQLVFPYTSANEKLDITFVRVKKPDGTVVTASASDVQDLSAPLAREAPIYTDLRQKHVTVPGLRPGDTLEYQARWDLHTAYAANHFWLEHDFVKGNLIVLNDELEVNVPAASKVKLKTAAGMDPNIKEVDGRRIYSWKKANLTRPDKDKDKGEEPEKKEEGEDPKPRDVQMTTFQSWDEVAKWYAALEKDRIVPDDKIRAKTEELMRGRKTDEEKIETLYQFVAKSFRYVSLSLGQGRYQPHAAADVMANQYGDCKDKHTLLAAMLNAAGLQAYPALMNSTRKIDPDVPSPGQFDHVITAIPFGKETLWADTTAEIAPFRLLSPQLRNKSALVVHTNAPASLATTPAEPPFRFSEQVVTEGEVNEFGKLSGKSHLVLRGDSEMRFRMLFRRTPQSDWKSLGYYLAMIGGLTGSEISDIAPSEPAETEKPFELKYSLTSNDYLDWSSRKAKLALPLPSFGLSSPDANRKSAKPIELGAPTEMTYRVKLTLPAKYTMRMPVPVTIKRDYAEYSSSYKLEGQTVIAERRLVVQQREIPAERLQDYRAFVAAARADEAQTLAVESTVAGKPAIPETAKVEELVAAAETAAQNENFLLVEELLKRVLEKEPKNKDVRRRLGWAMFASRKFDDAIKVLREQAEINPYDDYVYNLMGQIYWQQQKYADAETSFRKQIEISPLDQYAHSNLGHMLVQWRKYKEAVPELEKAISLDADEEMLYVSLGRAYLNLNENAKALEAFDKAVKLKPGPLVWNDVSYILSLSKVQLDRAQQYAESAVTAVATELRNIELDRLDLADLGKVASIAAYWDTLGWVHFQKGDLEVAERYIAASWWLGRHSEVGYHLGQIYEKQGKTADAIKMYALAANAERLVPEATESLERMGGKAQMEKLMRDGLNELNALQRLKFSSSLKDLKKSAEAQFYVVLTPGAARKAQVMEVKFISGDEKLREIGPALKAANFPLVFPDDASTRIIRRGTVYCEAAGQCQFFMLLPEFITSVD